MTTQSYEARIAAANRIIAEQVRVIATAHGALTGLLATHPVFRIKPSGAPGSVMRSEQDEAIAAEDAAHAAIALIEGRPRFPAAVSSEHPAQAEVTIIMAEG
jgi:hypothetical protein